MVALLYESGSLWRKVEFWGGAHFVWSPLKHFCLWGKQFELSAPAHPGPLFLSPFLSQRFHMHTLCTQPHPCTHTNWYKCLDRICFSLDMLLPTFLHSSPLFPRAAADPAVCTCGKSCATKSKIRIQELSANYSDYCLRPKQLKPPNSKGLANEFHVK